MSAWAYYNEIDEAAAHVIREQIKAGTIMDGEVDTRSIKDVDPFDLVGFRQCHFFAGGGIWSVSARLARWPDERELWTGSCPCQGESVAGKKLGADDPRHLWPDLFRLIRARRPAQVVGEQVARAAGTHWLDGVWTDMEAAGYAFRAVDFPACAVDAPHIRHRLYWAGALEGVAEPDGRVGGWRADEQERRSQGRDADRRIGERGVDQVDPYRAGRGELRGAEPVQPELSRIECAGGDARDGGVDMVDASSIGRREGRPEPVVWSGRDATGGAGGDDERGVVQDDAVRGRHGAEDEALCAGRIGAEPSGGWDEGVGQAHSDEQRCPRFPQARVHERWDGAGSVSAEGREPDRTSWDDTPRCGPSGRNGSYWSGHEWRIGADGKARCVEPGLRLLVDGLPGRVPLLRIAGNAIVAEAGAEVLAALMEAIP